jgi:hypothetical protein
MNSPYARESPSPQQKLDVFAGKWASRFPGEFAELNAGATTLFEDPRINWAKEKFAELGVSIKGSSVLELGPLEGGHTYMLSKHGAASVTAVEAHSEAYLRCLVAKELLGMERVNFLLGDAVAFLRQIGHSYDIGIAAGFLYHMSDPVGLIELLCRHTRAVYLWTVYWDSDFSKKNPGAHAGSGPVSKHSYKGFDYTLHKHPYGDGFDYGKFWGGPADHSNWMEKEDIERAFSKFGFGRQICKVEDNPHGAALNMVAIADA